VVTGGGRGIGKAIASELARMGADVTLMDRIPLEEQVKEIRDAYAVKVEGVSVDLAQPDSIKAAFSTAAERLGPVSVLVNNAGIAHAAPILRTDLAKWNELIAIDLTAPYLCIQQVLKPMTTAGFGRIVNVSSTAGLTGYGYVTAYCAAKHGLIGLTRSLAIEVAKTGVTVNAVCPGYADTAIVADTVKNIVSKTDRTPEQALAELVVHNPQNRLIKPEEVAGAVGWLCLPGSQSVTGQSILIAGGELM
jgi:NAD(P)-dependent dehydrogenase (short-subunit alcohol dehydrogenase family)